MVYSKIIRNSTFYILHFTFGTQKSAVFVHHAASGGAEAETSGCPHGRKVNVSAVKSQYYLQYISIKCAINFAASLDKPKIGCIIKSSNIRAAAAPRERGGLLCLCALARSLAKRGPSAERGGKAAAFCFAAQNKKALDGIKRHDPCGLHGPYIQIF